MSHERSSLVHERCTTCGSLLPCDLHNRELKRVMLRGEKEELPGFEKVWVDGTRHDYKGATKVLDGVIVCYGSDCEASLLRRNSWETDKWDFETIKEFRRFLENGSIGFRTLCTLGQVITAHGDILCLNSERRLVLYHKHEFLGGYWDKDSSFASINDDHTINANHSNINFFQVGDDAFLFVCNIVTQDDLTSNSNKSIVEFTEKISLSLICRDEHGRFRERYLHDEAGELMKPTVGSSLGSARTSDGGFILIRSYALPLYLMPPLDQTEKGWRVEELRINEGREIFSLNNISNLTPLSDGRFLFSYGEVGCIGLLEADQDIPGTWKASFINHSKLRPDADECSFAVFSPRCFITVWNDNEVDIWMMDKDGKWNSTPLNLELGLGSGERPIVVPTSSDPMEFLLFFDYKVSLWRIPPDKLRAYRERQIVQKKLPSLPIDL